MNEAPPVLSPYLKQLVKENFLLDEEAQVINGLPPELQEKAMDLAEAQRRTAIKKIASELLTPNAEPTLVHAVGEDLMDQYLPWHGAAGTAIRSQIRKLWASQPGRPSWGKRFVGMMLTGAVVLGGFALLWMPIWWLLTWSVDRGVLLLRRGAGDEPLAVQTATPPATAVVVAPAPKPIPQTVRRLPAPAPKERPAPMVQIMPPAEVHVRVETPDLIRLSWRAVGPGVRYNVYSSASRDLAKLRKENQEPMKSNQGTWVPETGLDRYWVVVTSLDAEDHESAYSEAIEVVRHPEKGGSSGLLEDAAGAVKKALPW